MAGSCDWPAPGDECCPAWVARGPEIDGERCFAPPRIARNLNVAIKTGNELNGWNCGLCTTLLKCEKNHFHSLKVCHWTAASGCSVLKMFPHIDRFWPRRGVFSSQLSLLLTSLLSGTTGRTLWIVNWRTLGSNSSCLPPTGRQKVAKSMLCLTCIWLPGLWALSPDPPRLSPSGLGAAHWF